MTAVYAIAVVIGLLSVALFFGVIIGDIVYRHNAGEEDV